MKPPRIVVVGGGIAGLATAHDLVRAGACVALVEASERLGGNIRTERFDGFTIDCGPDSWVSSKPHATELAKELGLESQLIGTRESTRKVYVVWEGGLHPIPEGLILGVPTRVMPMVTTPLFTWDAKLRMALEPLIVPRAFADDEDESIADFISRRLGEQVTERLAAPLLGGIYAGDAGKISMRAAFPQLVEAEQKYGSLIVAMRKAAKLPPQSGGTNTMPPQSGGTNTMPPQSGGTNMGRGAGKAPSAFVSLKDGVGALVDALAARLEHVEVHAGAAVERLAKLEPPDARGAYAVEIRGRAPLFCEHVVLACPSYESALLLRDIDRTLAGELDAIPYTSTATVFLAFAAHDLPRPLDATGFVVPHVARRPILASTWVSAKWEHRAPPDYALLRVFFGGAWSEAILEESDDELVRVARRELAALMGVVAAPQFSRVFRFARKNALPLVGHLARMKTIRARALCHAGLHLAGAAFGGGIPECVRQGREIALSILHFERNSVRPSND